ncbi:unnamed protein product, partial [Durusdinium trenchii]
MAGLQFPANEKGERSTTSFNKAVYSTMASSLGAKDLEDKIKGEKDWRHKYCLHLDQLVEQTLLLKDSAKLQEVLSKGLEKARAMDFDAGSGPVPLKDALSAAVSSKFTTVKISGTGTTSPSFVLPYNGKELTGEALEKQCDQWSAYGTMEPDCAAAIKAGAQRLHAVKGRTFLVLGAGSELGPVRPLLEA